MTTGDGVGHRKLRYNSLSRLPAIFLMASAKSAITHGTENSKSSRVLKIDIPSVIDVNKNKHKHVGRREVNKSTLF